MKQMFVRASVVLRKRFEHNLAAEGGCVLHCGSLMPAAAASFCAFWVRVQVEVVSGSRSRSLMFWFQ